MPENNFSQFFNYHLFYRLPILAVVIFICSCTSKPGLQNQDAPSDTTESGRVIAALNEKINAEPNNAEWHYQRSKIYFEKKEMDKSLADIQKALSIDSTQAQFYVIQADLQFTANKTLLAKQSLEKCLSLDPGNKDANMKLAEIYFYVKQYEKSISYLDGVLKQDLHNAKAYFMKGMNFKEMGDTTHAISSFQTAVEQDQNFYPAYMQLGLIMQAKNNHLTVQYYTAAIKINPKSEEAFYGRGLYYQDHDDLDKAIQDYTTLSEINPNNKQAYFNLGYLHYTYLKVYDQAVKHYNQAIAVDANYTEAYYNRGLAYEAMGDIAAAKKDYEKALQLRATYEAASRGLARVSR
jgi:tetratricopeptide (TPR) repeat protein